MKGLFLIAKLAGCMGSKLAGSERTSSKNKEMSFLFEVTLALEKASISGTRGSFLRFPNWRVSFVDWPISVLLVPTHWDYIDYVMLWSSLQ